MRIKKWSFKLFRYNNFENSLLKKMTVEALFPPEEYSSVEQERIIEFRSRCANLELTEEQGSDAQLVRWLRARNLDVDKALEMLKISLEWRRENKVDGILEREDVPKDVQRMTPFANLGVDRDGYPIILLPMGRQDGRTLLEAHGSDKCFRFNTINCEKVTEMLRKVSKEQGRQVTQIVEIIDLEGYNYRQLTSKLCRDFMIRMQTSLDMHYPELLRYAIVINAPKIFHVIFSVLKPFIPKQTLEKVDIYGPEPEKWKKTIAERFPLELIPPHWGGTRQGSDEFCSKNSIWLQGPVPVSFFTNGTLSPCNEDNNANLTPATINPRDTFKISLDVTKYNSSIAWRFHSNNHDIGFQILFQNGKVIVPFSRVQSQKHLQEGTHLCSQLGTYTIVFDNTYSLARSKTVYYFVSVIEPEEMNSNYVENTSTATATTTNSEVISTEPLTKEITCLAASTTAIATV